MRDGPPHESLSAAVERFRADEAEARRALWAGVGEAWRVPRFAIPLDEARDLLRDAVSSKLAPEPVLGALASHLGRIAAERVLAPAREMLSRLPASSAAVSGERVALPALRDRLLDGAHREDREAAAAALAGVASRLVGELVDARDEADELAATWTALAPKRPDAPPDDTTARAAAFLDATEDAYGELATRMGGPESLAHAAGLATWPAKLFRADTRFRRLGTVLAPLGLERELSAHVRTERSVALDPRPRVVVRAPRDVRIGVPDAAGGALELAAADAVGRALMLALASPSLPTALARPLDATVPRATGALLAGLLAEPRVLTGRFGLSARDAAGLARGAGYVLLASARVHAAALVARDALAKGDRDAPADLFVRAAGFAIPGALVDVAVRASRPLAARARGALAGLALHVALREHFDEDFERNPRTAEPLRAAAARGGGLSSESWLAELGFSDVARAAASRAAELAR